MMQDLKFCLIHWSMLILKLTLLQNKIIFSTIQHTSRGYYQIKKEHITSKENFFQSTVSGWNLNTQDKFWTFSYTQPWSNSSPRDFFFRKYRITWRSRQPAGETRYFIRLWIVRYHQEYYGQIPDVLAREHDRHGGPNSNCS